MIATVLCGSGRFQDRWHDYAATGFAVARLLGAAGFAVEMRSTKPAGFTRLRHCDLLVANFGSGRYREDVDGPAEEWAAAHAALRGHVESGRPVLALHSAANAFGDSDAWAEPPAWAAWLGGRWVPGRSMHPPIGAARVRVAESGHPITAGMADFTVVDERYSHLDVHPSSRVLLAHVHEGAEHPLVWVSGHRGARVVYDALGHGPESYRSPERAALLCRTAEWLVGRAPGRS